MDQQESKLFTVLKWVFGLAIAWAASFFVLGAIKGILGIIACVVIGTVAIQAWPFLQFVTKNAVINLFKWRAKKDPIGSAQTVEMELTEELNQFREETIQIDAETSTFEREVRKLEREYPDDPELHGLQEQLKMLQETVVQRREDEATYATNLTAYRAGIKRMEAMWNASQIGARASKRANMSSKQYQRLVAQTSFDTVQKSMDQARARLVAARARAQEQRAALPPKVHRETIDVTPAKEKVPARRTP